MINVKLTGPFVNLAPEGSEKGEFTVEHRAGTTLSALLMQIGMDSADVKHKAFVNNERKPTDYVLEDSDSIIVMPLLSGG